MTPETHSLWSGILSLLGFLLWQMYQSARRDVDALRLQNDKQETAIATLQANVAAHAGNTDRLTSAIDRLDSKIEALARSLSERRTSRPPR